MYTHQSFLASEPINCEPDKALFHIIPAPFEASVSYGCGTANGPSAILQASDQLELWDGSSIPAELGIHTCTPVATKGSVEQVLQNIELAAQAVLDAGAMPVLLGGEHTVSFGVLKALKKHNKQFGIIHFDAHADLRDTYEGSAWSHACVMRRAVEDLNLPIVQFGVRALSFEEETYRQQRGILAHDAAKLAVEGCPAQLLPDNFPQAVYLSFDIDALDPSIMPATGTPVPGGLGWYQTLDLLERSLRGRKVLGFDVVELAPMQGLHAPDFAAARLVYAIMGLVQRMHLSS